MTEPTSTSQEAPPVNPDHNFDSITVKHLEMIQTVIARLANDSFLMKGWTLTVAGIFYGFAAKDLNWRVAGIGVLPVIAFWCLDAYFLSRERVYRAMYEAVRVRDARVQPLSMDYRPFIGPKRFWPWKRHTVSWWRTFWSGTLSLLYAPILLVGIILLILARYH